MLTERAGRGCFDPETFGWGYQYEQWLANEQEKLDAYREENVLPPAIFSDLRSQIWRPDPSKNPILYHQSPLTNA